MVNKLFQPPEIIPFSRLRPFIADSEEDGKDTVLIIKGFSGADEIQKFTELLMTLEVLRPSDSLKQ